MSDGGSESLKTPLYIIICEILGDVLKDGIMFLNLCRNASLFLEVKHCPIRNQWSGELALSFFMK